MRIACSFTGLMFFLLGAVCTLFVLQLCFAGSLSGAAFRKQKHLVLRPAYVFTGKDQYTVAPAQPCPVASSFLSAGDVQSIESRASEWMWRLPAELGSLYDSHSLPSPGEVLATRKTEEGMDAHKNIWQTIVDPLEPGSKFDNYYEVFGLFPPTAPCREKQSLGSRRGGEGKTICSEWHRVFELPSCLVYSLGGNNEWEFEESIINDTLCTVHTFDCTITPRIPVDLQGALREGRLVFHKWCIASSVYMSEEGWEFLTLTEIGRKLGHSEVHLLKMDIEAFEHDIIRSWTQTSAIIPELLSLEYHQTTVPLMGKYRRKAAGEIAVDFVHMYQLGLRIVSVEKSLGGAEITFIRTMCPASVGLPPLL